MCFHPIQIIFAYRNLTGKANFPETWLKSLLKLDLGSFELGRVVGGVRGIFYILNLCVEFHE